MTQHQELRDHAFTKGLSDGQVGALALHATEVSFQAEELVLTEGQHSRFFYLITSGSVAVELRTSAYAVCVQALGPGEAFGWSALLPSHNTLFQVRARKRPLPCAWKESL